MRENCFHCTLLKVESYASPKAKVNICFWGFFITRWLLPDTTLNLLKWCWRMRKHIVLTPTFSVVSYYRRYYATMCPCILWKVMLIGWVFWVQFWLYSLCKKNFSWKNKPVSQNLQGLVMVQKSLFFFCSSCICFILLRMDHMRTCVKLEGKGHLETC